MEPMWLQGAIDYVEDRALQDQDAPDDLLSGAVQIGPFATPLRDAATDQVFSADPDAVEWLTRSYCLPHATTLITPVYVARISRRIIFLESFHASA